jgi:YidC/Oxa1 family membrane protein insertase
MDKRSILFIVVLTAAFFLINNVLFPPKYTPQVAEKVAAAPAAAPQKVEKPQEQLFVIENEFQQLVFSSLGGALAEINLPLQSEKNIHSVVKGIDADRTLAKKYPESDQFPNGPYQTYSGAQAKGVVGGYYPLLRRSAPPQFRGLAVVSDDAASASTPYRVKRLEKNLIELEGENQSRRITKTISFPENPHNAPYCFDVTIKIEGDARGLMLTTGVPEVELISGSWSPSLKYRLTRNSKPLVEQIDLPKTATSFSSIHPDWISNSNGFLGMIIDPLNEIGGGFVANQVPGDKIPTRLTVIDAEYDLYPASKYPGYDMRLPFGSASQTVTFRVFAGPFASDVLKKIDSNYSDPKTGYNPDFIACQSFHGWFSFISEPFAKFLFFLIEIFHAVTRSWGISIILLTLALRIMLYPLNAWSLKSTARMQKVAPKVAAVQEKYKKDPKKAQMEIMNLYREEGVNPLGGCVPLLIQMPFLIGMFDLLKSTFELRGASFIPGWIDNLTAPDVVFSWNYPLWFFGTSFHLLPIILGGVMYWQQQMTTSLPKDKKLWTDQQKQQRFMGNMMVLVFAVLFYHFPSGLNIYWLSSMLLGILQQWWTMKKTKLKGPIKK